MTHSSLISVDLAKSVFQVCGLNHHKVQFNKALRRSQLLAFFAQQEPTQVVMEACYSSHYWAREFSKLGHQVRLIPAQHVKPFVRGNKNDRNDALAIAEASLRPNIRCVPVKTIEQQDLQSLHRIREQKVSQRTRLINQTRGLLSEYGIIAPQGIKSFRALLSDDALASSHSLTPLLTDELRCIQQEYDWLTERITQLNKQLAQIASQHPIASRLISIPGIGCTIATALVSAIGNGHQFDKARQLSVWLGVTPSQHASGLQSRLGGITKRGNRYLRKQVIHGARAILARKNPKEDPMLLWAKNLAERKGTNKAAVALANRMMRVVWALLKTGEVYSPQRSGC